MSVTGKLMVSILIVYSLQKVNNIMIQRILDAVKGF